MKDPKNQLPAFRFEVSQIDFPYIYNADTFRPDTREPAREQYGLSFPIEEFPAKIVTAIDGAAASVEWFINNGKEHYRLRSFFPPLMTEVNNQYEELAKRLALADVRNIKRDRLFYGMPAELVVRPFGVASSQRPQGHFGLGLEEIIFKIENVQSPELIERWDKEPVL